MGGSANQGALTETVFYILLRLHHPAHGYALMKDIGEMTDHRVSPGAGTLYGALETLQKKGWVTPLEGRMDGRKKEYVITDEGRRVFERDVKRLEELLENARKLKEELS
ncbi:PadR family transcriptional regulator [Olsenella uli]|uniref:PadR family transcriptional regulator n=1 Tax=Olsenella uli TaxID=133926 RepID=UPI00325FB82E